MRRLPSRFPAPRSASAPTVPNKSQRASPLLRRVVAAHARADSRVHSARYNSTRVLRTPLRSPPHSPLPALRTTAPHSLHSGTSTPSRSNAPTIVRAQPQLTAATPALVLPDSPRLLPATLADAQPSARSSPL